MLPGLDAAPLRREFAKLLRRVGADPANIVHRTGAETIADVKTFTHSPVVPPDFCWMTKAIGEPFPLRDDLAGVEIPPTDNAAYRYIRLTASDAYNSGVLTSQSVSGSAPEVIATAVISLAGSPINGLTVNLLNTERRFIRAGSSGTVEFDAMQGHKHGYTVGGSGGTAGGDYLSNGSGGSGSTTILTPVTDGSNGTPRTTIETRPKNQGATFYMRVK